MALKIEDTLPNNWNSEEILSHYKLSLIEFSLEPDTQYDDSETEKISELAEIKIKGVKETDIENCTEFYKFLPDEITLNLTNWVYFRREDEEFEIDEFNSGEIYLIANGLEYELCVEEIDSNGLIDDAIYNVCNQEYIDSNIQKLKDEYQRQEEEFEAVYEDDQRKIKTAKVNAKHWLDEKSNCLDTETTGLGEKAQVIEIAVYDNNDNEVFYSKIKPTVTIDAGAQNVHGISLESLNDAPSWPDISDKLQACLIGHPVIIFNSKFDIKLLQQTATAFDDPAPWITKLTTHCAMYLAADCYGATNQYGSISLTNAMRAAGVKWRGDAHSASGDVLATLDLVKAIAKL